MNVHTPAASDHALLLRDIPRTASITAVSAHQLLHRYFGGSTAWLGRANALDAAQIAALTPGHDGPGKPLTSDDAALMAALQRDGRAGLAEPATATGWSAATVARRLAGLQAGGTVFFDLEIDPEPLGATTQALLWMAVAPAQLDRVAQALCPDAAALHHYLTHRLGALEAICCGRSRRPPHAERNGAQVLSGLHLDQVVEQAADGFELPDLLAAVRARREVPLDPGRLGGVEQPQAVRPEVGPVVPAHGSRLRSASREERPHYPMPPES